MASDPLRPDPETSPSADRRRVLARMTQGLGCAGACALAYPFFDSLTPPKTAATDADAPLVVDFSDMSPDTARTVQWQGMPLFLMRRSVTTLAALQRPDHVAALRDPASRARQQPVDAVNWHRSLKPEFGIYIGICTHLGCIPQAIDALWRCPCHGSRFDAAGRAFADAPAPYNLPVPPATMLGPARFQIGRSIAEPAFGLDALQAL